jgi:hypothetical protein
MGRAGLNREISRSAPKPLRGELPRGYNRLTAGRQPSQQGCTEAAYERSIEYVLGQLTGELVEPDITGHALSAVRCCRYCQKDFQPSQYGPQQAVCSRAECQRRRRTEYHLFRIQGFTFLGEVVRSRQEGDKRGWHQKRTIKSNSRTIMATQHA